MNGLPPNAESTEELSGAVPAPKRPRRRFWRRAGQVVLGLIVLLAVVWVVLTLYFGHELDAKLAQLRAEGQPLTIAQAAPEPAPDDQNAAVLYRQVFQIDFADPMNWKPFAGLTTPEERFLGEYCRRPSPETDAQAAALLSRPEVQRALAILEEASQRPACVFPVDWQRTTPPFHPELSKFRPATILVTTNAVLESRRGHPEQASRWFAVGVRMSRHVSEPTLVSQLIRYALLAILWRDVESVSDELSAPGPYAADLDRALAEQNLNADFLTAVHGQRARGLEIFNDLRAGHVDRLGLLENPEQDAKFARAYEPPMGTLLASHDELFYLNYWNQALPLMAQPYTKRYRAMERLDHRLHSGFRLGKMTSLMLLPVYSGASCRRDEAQAEIDFWRVALALKGYKAAHGLYPATLADLQKSLSWTIPPDPFSGKPYVYRPEGAGFLVYSFGRDMKDDSGQSQWDAQGKWHEEGDLVWRCER